MTALKYRTHGTGGWNNQDDSAGGPSGDGHSGDGPSIGQDTLGLTGFTAGFIGLVDAIVAAPVNGFITAGFNGATDAASKLFWTYAEHELTVVATSGFLTTKTGDGGFVLHVEDDGSWSLRFSGARTVIGHEAGEPQKAPPPPSPALPVVNVPGTGAAVFDASKSPAEVINGGLGWDTFQGGAGDYMIGGSGTAGGGLAGKGNCAIYTASPGSVLVDMQNSHGYGGNAEGNTYVNMNQVRGSLNSNVLIGGTTGTDLKTGGSGTIAISTGGTGFELRPDGAHNLLVSTAGGDRLAFDPTKGWALGDDNIMVGFDLKHGCTIDLTLLTNGKPIASRSGPAIASTFHAASSTGNIADYVRIDDKSDGSHVYFSPIGDVRAAGIELVDLKFTHGLDVASMFAKHQIMA